MKLLRKIIDSYNYHKKKHNLKEKMYSVIFEADTWSGKLFDVILIGFITVSLLLVVLESMPFFSTQWKTLFWALEWVITIFFTIEYIVRVYCSPNRKKFIFSFFGIIDLLATLPFYLEILYEGTHFLLLIRVLRLIRIFRVFRLFSLLSEGNFLLRALRQSSRKIFVFFCFIFVLAIAIGTVMYVVESHVPNSDFNNIPNSIYWTIVTITTVGYGDISPVTPLGRLIASLVMLLGYTIIAVPTGIVSVDFFKLSSGKKCPHCNKAVGDHDATYCKYCGQELDDQGKL